MHANKQLSPKLRCEQNCVPSQSPNNFESNKLTKKADNSASA